MNTNTKLNNKQILKSVGVLYGYNPNSEKNYLNLNNDKTKLTINKESENSSNTKIVGKDINNINNNKIKVKNQWTFVLDKFYTEGNLDIVFNDEILKKKHYFNFQKNFKGSLIFLTQSKDTFINTEGKIFNFTQNCMSEIFDECFGTNISLTISYLKFNLSNNNVYKDMFDFNNSNNNEFTNINLMSNEDDIKIKNAKEIKMENVDNFKTIFKLLESKIKNFNSLNKKSFMKASNIVNNKKNIYNDEFNHEVLTIRMYDSNKHFFSKFNFILFKSYIYNYNNSFNLVNNTKENNILFNAIIRNSYRDTKFTRYIQDTSIYNCFVIANIPADQSSSNNIILMHDILNLINIRQSNIILDYSNDNFEEELKNEFEKIKISNNSQNEKYNIVDNKNSLGENSKSFNNSFLKSKHNTSSNNSITNYNKLNNSNINYNKIVGNDFTNKYNTHKKINTSNNLLDNNMVFDELEHKSIIESELNEVEVLNNCKISNINYNNKENNFNSVNNIPDNNLRNNKEFEEYHSLDSNQINIERLKKIKNKDNLKFIFDCLENC